MDHRFSKIIFLFLRYIFINYNYKKLFFYFPSFLLWSILLAQISLATRDKLPHSVINYPHITRPSSATLSYQRNKSLSRNRRRPLSADSRFVKKPLSKKLMSGFDVSLINFYINNLVNLLLIAGSQFINKYLQFSNQWVTNKFFW